MATEVDGLLQPPILIHRSAFALADALNGDVGLRDLLRGENAPVTSVALDAPHPDIDTPADLDRAHRIGHMFDSSEEGESR